MYRLQSGLPDESQRPALGVSKSAGKPRWLPALWLALTVSLLALAGGILTALLTSSAKQPLAASSRFAFEVARTGPSDGSVVAAERLARQLAQYGSSISLVPEGEFWLYAELSAPAESELVLEVRHLRATRGDFQLLDTSTGVPVALEWQHSKGGIAISLPPSHTGSYRIIANVTPRYSTVLKLFLWDRPEFSKSIEGFNRMGGALAGACTVLALTMGLLGLRNRDFVAVLFGLTILLMLRIAAFNSGWDMQWLGIDVPSSLTMTLLRATLPLYAITQTALFITLFQRELAQVKSLKTAYAMCAFFAALFLMSPFLDHDTFLRAWWMMSAPGAAWLIYALARVVTKTKDRAARLYALALVVTMSGGLAEIAYMLGYWDTRVSSSLLGVLLGSALNAAAVAERLYTDRALAVEAQRREINALREKDDIFQSSPIPLFEFNASGVLKHGNLAFGQFVHGSTALGSNHLHWDDIFGTILQLESMNAPTGAIESVRLDKPARPREEKTFCYVDLRWTRDGSEIRGSVQDVTDREMARQAMQRMVNYDQLTGVLNVHGLLASVNEAPEGNSLGDFSVALFDIARFEAINELFGHEAADVVLKIFASRIASQCHGQEKVARIGADTFAIVFPSCSIDATESRVREISLSCTQQAVAVGGKAIAIAVCVGVVAPAESVSLEQAIGASLRATQRAKRKRSGPVTIALETRESLGEYLNEKKLLGRIVDRLPTENFFQLMQPIVNLRDPRGKFAAEALIRMRSETGETIPPGHFIAAAERNGMMPEIDRWTLRTACQWLNEKRDSLDALEYLTVNVSGVSLNDVQFHADVRAILADFPQESRKLCFEITESIAVSDIEATTRFTEQLRTLGAKVALDDFGAGYTSFGYLRTIPAEILKIDGEIIKSVATDSSSAAILRAIRDIAGDLGMRCVAEFVTDFKTLRALRELDIDFGQGYALSRPISPSILTTATCGADLISDQEVVRYLDASAGRNFTRSSMRATR